MLFLDKLLNILVNALLIPDFTPTKNLTLGKTQLPGPQRHRN